MLRRGRRVQAGLRGVNSIDGSLSGLPAVSLEEYLNTSYDPDVEFVDGVLVERNIGDWSHSLIQTNVLFALRRKYPRLKVVAGLRSNTAATRYRIPDVSVLLAAPHTDYLLDAAFVAVEVLSEDDVMSKVTRKLKEYAAKGVPNIWLIDPREQLMWVYRPPALVEIEETLSTTDGSIELFRAGIFAE
jgi:Uma2 family endonuclease